ncbi:SAFB-like transcription modulator [Teleopsis dalmanni]|uniref:SAFB-like transcription modulator n=1 Tax=Teleopsis dalmanni TaxID=139649 RepID=UPI0018CF2B02|nr:SAFB-like transcription modulator [Teleopsis dalmanni]XP_037946011.1 SAFB-like transcription modulator [Teleopsis dalmanni]
MVETGKKLSELRVSDLKLQLEKRKMDTVGAKATLVERLEKALKQEGHDPQKYVFKSGDKITPKSKDRTGTEEIKIKEEPVMDGYPEDSRDGFQSGNENGDADANVDDEIDQVGTVDDECVIIENEDEESQYVDDADAEADVDADADADEQENEENERGEGDEVHEEEDEEEISENNNHDTEESINLTIGEEEQQLLHEAADEKEKTAEASKSQKDKSSAKEQQNIDKGKKDEKKGGKDEASNKNKKKEEKSIDKKDTSEHKSSTKSSHKDEKEKTTNASTVSISSKSSKPTVPSRNLWVSGLSTLTRASDLKTIFSKYGKVIGAKVVTNTRTPGSRCYGYVTMSSSSDATRCIENLNRTELHGRIISVERTKNEIGNTSNGAKDSAKVTGSRSASKKKDDDKKSSAKDGAKPYDEKRKLGDTKKDDKDKDKGKDKKDDKEAKDEKSNDNKRSRDPVRSKEVDKEREQRIRERERERERIRQREILSYQKIREERERQRLRQKERELREEERRRREIRDRQRQEEIRLAEERRKLAQERERLEREKAELMRLERERQKLEREKIELERLELKRQQMKMLQAREEPIKRHSKHTSDDRYAEVSERKRTTTNEGRMEAPPPPRFDASLVSSRSFDKKRDDYNSTATSKRLDYSKRDDYTSSSSKRSAIDDYTAVPAKRNTEDYANKRGDYMTGAKSSRDEYKREVEIRHIPSGSTNNTFHSKSNNSRYGESDRSNYRRTGMEEIRSSTNNVWPATGHMSGGNTIPANMHGWQKTIHTDDNTWRPSQGTQDRYDRTFNERAGYGNSGALYTNSGRAGQDRYGPISRY